MTLSDAIKHLEKKVLGHGLAGTAGREVSGTTFSAAGSFGCRCDDCEAVKALLSEGKRMAAIIERVCEAVK